MLVVGEYKVSHLPSRDFCYRKLPTTKHLHEFRNTLLRAIFLPAIPKLPAVYCTARNTRETTTRDAT